MRIIRRAAGNRLFPAGIRRVHHQAQKRPPRGAKRVERVQVAKHPRAPQPEHGLVHGRAPGLVVALRHDDLRFWVGGGEVLGEEQRVRALDDVEVAEELVELGAAVGRAAAVVVLGFDGFGPEGDGFLPGWPHGWEGEDLEAELLEGGI